MNGSEFGSDNAEKEKRLLVERINQRRDQLSWLLPKVQSS